MYKCSHCNAEFEKLGLIHGIDGCCPNCGDNRYLSEIRPINVEMPKPIEIPKPVVDLDFNKDGKVDKKDVSIAGRFLRSNRRKR